MARSFSIDRGLDLPISGVPRQEIESTGLVSTVALLGADFVGLKPTMEVREGEQVKLGQVLFSDKKTPGVRYTSPGAGKVAAIHRGPKRRFDAIVVELSGDDACAFNSYQDYSLTQLERRLVVEQLLQSGLWTGLRERPYSKVPSPDTIPQSVFITAIDTNPLAADPYVVLNRREREFVAGLQVLSTLTDGTTYLCKAPGANLPGTDQNCVEVVEFGGPHPAGLPGTHIHFLSPVSDERRSWHINYQDVIAVGHLFLTGELLTERVVSIGGPAARNPRLVRTRCGARLSDLLDGEYDDLGGNSVRVISGSVLSGRRLSDIHAHLGYYHLQVSLLPEGTQREFLGWLSPGWDKFSVTRAFAAAWTAAGSLFPLTTSTGGSRRAIVPIGVYEKVFPLDMVPPALLKALVTEDTEYAQQLGCLELDEEDLALCTFVCPGKYNYGPILRENLAKIEVEG